jgi:hypothetical protein
MQGFLLATVIEQVAATAELPETADLVLDLRGRVLLPGLIRCASKGPFHEIRCSFPVRREFDQWRAVRTYWFRYPAKKSKNRQFHVLRV